MGPVLGTVRGTWGIRQSIYVGLCVLIPDCFPVHYNSLTPQMRLFLSLWRYWLDFRSLLTDCSFICAFFLRHPLGVQTQVCPKYGDILRAMHGHANREFTACVHSRPPPPNRSGSREEDSSSALLSAWDIVAGAT